MRKRLTTAQVTELIQRFTAGATYTELTKRFGVGSRAVWHHLKKHNLLGTRQLGRPSEYVQDAPTFKCGTCTQQLPRTAFGVRTNFTRGGLRPVRWRCFTCEVTTAAMSRYRLTYEHTSALLTQPLCGLCGRAQNSVYKGRVRRMFIDHDHVTGRIRGALCENCNSGLGLVRDSCALLTSLQVYIERPAPILAPPEARPSVAWMRHITRRYGLSGSQYEQLERDQAGQCLGCKQFSQSAKFPRLLVDHCHAAGQVRGLLCYSCNLALGKFGNDPRLLAKARAYLT